MIQSLSDSHKQFVTILQVLFSLFFAILFNAYFVLQILHLFSQFSVFFLTHKLDQFPLSLQFLLDGSQVTNFFLRSCLQKKKSRGKLAFESRKRKITWSSNKWLVVSSCVSNLLTTSSMSDTPAAFFMRAKASSYKSSRISISASVKSLESVRPPEEACCSEVLMDSLPVSYNK